MKTIVAALAGALALTGTAFAEDLASLTLDLDLSNAEAGLSESHQAGIRVFTDAAGVPQVAVTLDGRPIEDAIGDAGAPAIPGAPALPGAPSVPGAPGVPGAPSLPGAPGVPGIPDVGAPAPPMTPALPAVPSIELPTLP